MLWSQPPVLDQSFPIGMSKKSLHAPPPNVKFLIDNQFYFLFLL